MKIESFNVSQLFFLVCFQFTLFTAAQPPNSIIERGDVSVSWLSQVQVDLALSEYTVKYSSSNKTYRAFNRENQLIGSLTSGKILLHPILHNSSSVSPWQTMLETESIEFEGGETYFPRSKGTVDKKENVIDFKNEYYTEQYVNSKEGIRQNFIIHKGPSDNQVVIRLKVKGLLLKQINDKEIAFCEESDSGELLTKLWYKDIKSWDGTGHSLESTLEIEEEYILLVVNTTDAIYPITVDPIFTTPSTTLEANQAEAAYGWSVSGAGDVNGDGYSDIIVGSRSFDNGQTDEGAAFIYHGSSSGISTSVSTMLESNQLGSWFGHSVSSAGDVNGDAYSDVIVGANYYSNDQDDEGVAFIYHGSDSGISSVASVMLEEDKGDATFGSSVSSAGDVNGDGYSDVIVGADDYVKGFNIGGAFVYYGTPFGVTNSGRTYLKSNSFSQGYETSVSSAGDVNGDGYSDVIIGAIYLGNGQRYVGHADIHLGSFSGISLIAQTTLESNKEYGLFGLSVSTAGDVNGDGFDDVIVGSSYYSNRMGAAFIYYGSNSGLSNTSNSILESNQEDAWFGNSVSSAGDVNGDGYSDVIVGGRHYDIGEADEGGAFIYFGSDSGISIAANIILESNQTESFFGGSVANAGDVNGDGYSDVIVGESKYDNGQTDEGVVFIYHGSTVDNKLLSEFSEISEYNIYPNPVRGTIFIDQNDLNIIDRISIYDAFGRKCDIQVSLDCQKCELEIPTSPGTYYLEVLTKSGAVFKEKLIVY